MSSNPKPSSDTAPVKAGKKRKPGLKIVVPAVLIAVAIAGGLFYYGSGKGEDESSQPVFTVKRGPLTISVGEQGTIKNREKVIVKSQAEGQNRIIWLIEEGKFVKKDDLLLELDSSTFVEKKDQQEITVTSTAADLVRARESLAVTKNQAESDISKAELAYRFAKLDVKKYTEGEYPQQLQEAQAKITIAEEELQRAEDRVTWSTRLHKEEYLTRTELQADELAAKRYQLDLKLARSQLNVLKKYTHQRKLAELESDVNQAKMALERANRKASADVLQAQAELKARESRYSRQQSQLKKILRQISYCKIQAPVAGQVVYATTGGRRHWRSSSQESLAEGQDVRERQELFHLPTAKAMMTEIKIQESSLHKVRVGMEARITVGKKVYKGHLAKIAPMPESQDWLNPGLKAFNTEIYFDEDNRDLRPGISCYAEVIVEEHTDVLYVPLQAVHLVKGKQTVYLQTKNGSKPQAVKLGLDNNRMVHVIEGLSAGQAVLMAPPLNAAEAEQGTNDKITKDKKQGTGNRKQETGNSNGKKQITNKRRKGKRQKTNDK